MPDLEEARAASDARPQPLAGNKHFHHPVWLYLLYPLMVPVMLFVAVFVLIPALAAMLFCAVGVNYRYCRLATYRALKQRQAILPFCRSYPLGLAIFTRKWMQPRPRAAHG